MSTQSTTRDGNYCAFISYSHADGERAKWLHRELEAYRVPRVLVGQKTAKGEIGRALGRIFIDRQELASGPMPEQIATALARSDNLIVVCSPRSCGSQRVDEEIRTFRALGRSHDRIQALIVDGKPNDSAHDCFPPALKSGADPTRALPLVLHSETLGADVRPEADGELLAKLKVVSGLLGIGLGELTNRHAAAERRRRMRLKAISAAMALLALAAGGSAWIAKKKAEESHARLERSIVITRNFADEVTDKMDDLQIPSSAADQLQVGLDGVRRELVALTADEERMLAEDADIALGASERSKRLSDLQDREVHATSSRALFRKLTELNRGSEVYWQGLGDASYQVGDLKRAQGYLTAAREAFDESIAVRSGLVLRFAEYAPAHGASADEQKRRETGRLFKRKLSAAHLAVAMLLTPQGRITEALENFELAHQHRRDIARAYPDDADKARDETVVLVERSEALGLAGRRQDQLGVLVDVIERRKVLHERATTNDKIKHARYLAWAHVAHGTALIESGSLRPQIVSEALRDLRSGQKLQEEVFKRDPTDAERMRDIVWTDGRLADALLLDGQLAGHLSGGQMEEARARYTGAVDMAMLALKGDKARGIQGDPTSLSRRRTAAFWLVRRAKASRLSGKLNEAVEDLKVALSYLETDQHVDPENRQLRVDLGLAYQERGRLERQMDDMEAAAATLTRARDVLQAVASEAPEALAWRQLAEEAESEAFAGPRPDDIVPFEPASGTVAPSTKL